MAKWGEGDPRWIVEEREDATNVNNWHWTEKNATGWSKTKLKSLLEGFEIKDDKYECKIKELSKIEGEASANNRKGKLIFFYEWEIAGEWKGKTVDSDTTYTGNFDIPNLSEENEADEVDVNVSIKSTKNDAYSVKEFMRKVGQDKVREQLAVYIKDLKEEYSRGLIKPSKSSGQINGSVNTKVTPVPATVKAEMNKPVSGGKSTSQMGVKIDTKSVTDKQEFKCRAGELYRAFTEKEGYKELQSKMIDTQNQIKVADGQIATLKRQIMHSQLVDRELQSLPKKTRTYESVGRMFILQPMEELQENLEARVQACTNKIKTIEKNKEYLEKVMKESEDNMRELILSSQKDAS